jgi:AcrR family transcriptional regulator
MALAEKTRTPRRAELVAVAARLFSQRGYHGTSMQDLGNELGIQRGSLYAHIGSKEELLFDVVEDGADRFLERGRQALESDGKAADRLRALLIGHVETATQHLEASTVFLNEWRYLSPELRDHIQAKRDRYEQTVREIIEAGIASGEFRADADIRFAATLVLSAGNWTYTWYHPGGDLTPEEIGKRFAELVTKGLEARE